MIIMFTIMNDLVSVMTMTEKMIAETDVYFELLPFESSLLEIIMLFV